ncbi:MAG: 23S rRNA pseudouridine(955/2504/2580) synthase RluC [Gammaproteobacteria bacterium]|nr:23S rRNA pseudouridine(955/2504/2580) synthase RluC [Gammaproteobacteria bacterium]
MSISETSGPPKVRFVDVDADQAGQRIDNFLLARLKGVPKSRIYRLLRKGEVRVNKGRIKASYRLQPGDSVRIPPVRQAEPAKIGHPGARVLSLIESSILLEEKGFLVINKPSGIAVHGGSGLSYGVIEALRLSRPEAPYLELVHRLDRDTSGCLIIAKKRSTLRELHALIRGDNPGHTLSKRYLALVQGEWRGGKRRVDAPLLKNTLKSGERVVVVSEQGKASLSIFRPVSCSPEASLVEVELVTGRTHQIRVHATTIGHPIAGDEKYGDETCNREMKFRGLSRLFLHAAELEFTLSAGERFRIRAPLEPKLETLLKQMALVTDKSRT